MMNIMGKQTTHWESKYSDTPGDMKGQFLYCSGACLF